MNVNFSRVTSAAATLLPLISSLFATALVGTAAGAQTPRPTEAQSQVNPFPKAGGNTQNRGRASDDKYWGMTDDNFLWNQAPLSRIPTQNGTELVGTSTWTYPQAINNRPGGDGRLVNPYGGPISDFIAPGITVDNVLTPAPLPGATVLTAVPTLTTQPGVTNAGALWAGGTVTGPSENPAGQNYTRALAVPRPTAAATNYIAANPTATFTWYPNVPGDAGVVRRYAIRVILPNIVDETTEARISDARYTVFYSFRDRAGIVQNRSKVCFVSQTSDSTAGAKYLSDTPTGVPSYFPFFSEASYGTVGGPTQRAQVVLDNTTADDPSTDVNGVNNQYVLADALQFEQRVAVVSSTPTLTPAHGGRKADLSGTAVAGSRQPGTGPNYQIGNNGTLDPIGTLGGIIMPNSAYGTNGFIGDPRDLAYSGNPNDFSVMFMGPEAYVRPKVLPDEYTGQYPFNRNLGLTGTYTPVAQPGSPIDVDPISGLPNGNAIVPPITVVRPTTLPADPNESVGTRLQVDPAAAIAGPALPNIPIQRVSANNFQSYRLNANAAPEYDLLAPAGSNKPVPLYSQIQVILARTVYVPDPETGVSNANLDGTKTIEVGEVLGLDWQTGAVIWRFPDRTYLPQQPGTTAQPTLRQPGFPALEVPGQGFRNPIIGYEQRPVYSTNTISSYVDVVQRPINQVPGIQGYDVDGNGVIDDTEVFIAPQGDNATAGLAGSVTIAGQIPVNGDVQIPVYNQVNVVPPPYNKNATPVAGVSTNLPVNGPDSNIIGTTAAPAGRYKTADPTTPVLTTVAYVASNNGVVYAFDPYGNNDNAYTEQEFTNNAVVPAAINPLTPRRIGRFRPGTTNVLWTFNANSLPRLRAGQYRSNPPVTPLTQNETVEQYNKRLFGEIPATLGFGGASPVIAYRKDENDPTIDRLTEEPRLFIGNQNGVMYALDASARSLSATTGVVGTLPFHKGEQPANTIYAKVSTLLPATLPAPVANAAADSRYRLDLKWWFETEAQSEVGGGAINSVAAVSINRLDAKKPANTASPDLVEKGVYFTSVAGRVYCLDWTGPVWKYLSTELGGQNVGHDVSLIWNGADPSAVSAQALVPPPTATGDPSFAYAAASNLNDNYRFHNQRSAAALARPDLTEGKIRPRWVYPSQYVDVRGAGYLTPRQAQAQPNSESNTGSNTYNDGVTAPIYGAPTLIDFPWTNPADGTTLIRHLVAVAANDRVDGDVAPTSGKVYLLDQAGDRRDFLTNPKLAAGSPRPRAYSSPLDQYAVLNEPLGRAAPAWTYRFQYGTYNAQGDLQIQNNADPALSLNHGTQRLNVDDVVAGVPDFNAVAQSQPSRRILPTLYFGSTGRVYAIDFDLATGFFTRWRPENSAFQPVPLPISNGVVRTELIPADIPNSNPNNELLPLPARQQILTDTNLQFRPILARTMPLLNDPSSVDGSITISGGPLQTRDSSINGTVATGGRTSPFKPTNDAPVLSPPGVGLDVTAAVLANRFQTTPGPTALLTTDRAVNQEIDDPLATTRGSRNPETSLTVFPVIEADPVADRSFQFPTLFVTTAGASSGLSPIATGGLYEISSNLDGEDTDTITTPPTSSLGTFDPQTSNRGWAFTTDLLRFNNSGHIFQIARLGIGGGGTGVSVLTPAYFPGTDPATNYITGEPANSGLFTPLVDVTIEGFGGVLKPLGVGALTTAANPHTGQAGLPLDANGLYFDKNVAVRYVSTITNDVIDPAEPYIPDLWRWGGRTSVTADPILDPTDDDGQIRLPGYSTPTLLSSLTAPIDTALNSNQLADGIRPDYDRYGTGTVTNPNLRNNDDFNPTGQNAVWIFAGGPDGTLVAISPALPRRFGGDGGSGLGGGVDFGQANGPLDGQGKIEIVDASRVPGLQSGTVRPDRSRDSVIALGNKNFYEWGETVYIAVYDVPKTFPAASRRFPFRRNASPTVSVDIVDTNGRIIQTLTGRLGPGSYPSDPNYFPGSAPPAGATAADFPTLGVAIVRYRLNQGSAQTPGTILTARLSANPENFQINRTTGNRFVTATVAGGANDAQIAENSVAPFQIANPLAVQAFIKDTQGNPALPNGANANRTANSIGPFLTRPDAKNLVADRTTAATILPDNTTGFYSQALSNGNEIRRYDITPYTTTTGGNARVRLNRNVNRRLSPNDPTFFVPVVAGIGFGDHGKSASSDGDAGRRYLRIANRSLLQNLRNVRVQVRDDILWRTWPGAIPNTDATDGTGTLPNGTPTGSGGNNPRLTPSNGGNYLMRPDGIVNFLPWEQPVPEVQPWKRSTIGNGATGAGGNTSQDYPDIAARAQGALDSQVVSVRVNNVDLASGQGSLLASAPATPNGAGDRVATINSSVSNPVLRNPFASVDNAANAVDQTILRQNAATLNVKIPKFQPANLVAIHSVTSTYLSPNANNDETGVTQTTTGGGDVQLPQTAADRRLSELGNNGLPNNNLKVSPFGYTTRLRVYIDSNNNGTYDDTEAYRDVETWMGVAVDQSLSANEKSPVEVTGPTGGLAMGFGMQNGFLGYNQGGAFAQGLLPAPLFNTATFTDSPYRPFFASFAVKNRGNVNMWNLRAAQRASNFNDGSLTAFYQLRSTTVDPLQGIFSFGADPALGVMPQVVTSLDANLDASWQTYFQAGNTTTNPLLNPVDANVGSQTIYQQYYAGLGGKHTLHKPRVGDPVDSGTLLSIPDVPSAQPLTTDLTVNLAPAVPVLSIAVPIGTPSGTYGPVDTAPADFYVFEDHDTEVPYSAVPILNGGVISPAGPLYAGQNILHPGANSVLPVTGANILRPRTAATATAAAEPLPRTDPGIRLKVKVVEGGLTGQIPDQAAGLANTFAVTTGILPFIDQQPLLQLDTTGANPVYRPTAALSPAAYRDANGNLNTFFARNASAAGAAATAPGQPYNLFVSSLAWDAGNGQWRATNPGTGPVAASYGAAPGGQWFTPPAIIPAGPGGSNTSPFVLQRTVNNNGNIIGGDASLFFLNTATGSAGTPVREIYSASLTPGNGIVAVGTAIPLILNADPSLQRFGPRAVYDPTSTQETTLTFFYGGVAGKWTLYYVPATPGAGGQPTAATANRRERPLSLPLAITSASDPVPVLREIVEPGTNRSTRVVDLYYTGTSRTDRSPNIYMTRYVIGGSGDNARLNAQSLVPRTKEVLSATTGSGLYKARDIAWVRDGNPVRLPQIYINNVLVTNSARWAYDDTTNLLYQKFQRAAPAAQGVTFVYADVSAGTVRFRGAGAPTGAEVVSASYVPQTYRLTLDGVGSTSVTGFFDDRTLLDSATENGLIQQTTAQNARDYVVRRPTNTLVAGRTWLVWNQSAKGSSAAGLQMLTRRVGADLKTVAVSGTNLTAQGTSLSPRTDNPESIALFQSLRDANNVDTRIQLPQITGLTIDGANITDYEVDAANGRIYVDPRYEGHRLAISYNAQPGANGAPVQRTAVYDLAQINDLDPTVPSSTFAGQGVPMQRSVNENQPYAFLDRFDPRTTTSGRNVAAPNPVVDPVTQPGRVWLFWTSPRSRTGVLRTGPNPTDTFTVNGFDVYWQTLAPFFDFSSYKP